MQVLPGGALCPSSQEGGNVTDTNKFAMTAPGSVPVTPLPPNFTLDDTSLPLPKIPDTQIPVSTQPGHYGGVGLPASRPNQTAPLRVGGLDMPQGAGSGGRVEPQQDGGNFTTGPQPGGNQGGGNPGAGDSGNAALWKSSPSFRPPAWGSQNTND